MFNYNWKIYNTTEEDCIEYNRCIEMLEDAGLPSEEIVARALNCSVCLLSGRYPVIEGCIFLGARTC